MPKLGTKSQSRLIANDLRIATASFLSISSGPGNIYPNLDNVVLSLPDMAILDSRFGMQIWAVRSLMVAKDLWIDS
jgi:hypothetical protein